jgi:hypothetical protein
MMSSVNGAPLVLKVRGAVAQILSAQPQCTGPEIAEVMQTTLPTEYKHPRRYSDPILELVREGFIVDTGRTGRHKHYSYPV